MTVPWQKFGPTKEEVTMLQSNVKGEDPGQCWAYCTIEAILGLQQREQPYFLKQVIIFLRCISLIHPYTIFLKMNIHFTWFSLDFPKFLIHQEADRLRASHSRLPWGPVGPVGSSWFQIRRP